MIQYVSGDILLTEAKAIAHGVAPNDHYNQGLAHSLRELAPSMYEDFRHYCHQHHPKEGSCWLWAGPGKVIINLFTQEHAPGHSSGHPGRATKEYVNHALRDLAKVLQKEKITSVALPKLATGVGGLKWEEVQALIEHHLKPLQIPVIVYSEFKAGVKAKENI